MSSKLLKVTLPFHTFITRLSLIREHPAGGETIESRICLELGFAALQISHAPVTLEGSRGEIWSCCSIASAH
jgi:hypothetical protein